MDVATRWNSAYDMIERYLEQQAAVMAVLTQSDIRRNARDICTLSDDDITNLEELVTVLKPLSTVTALLCDACRPTISLVLPLRDRLLATLPPQTQDSASLVSAVKLAMIGNLSGRYQAEDLQLYLWQASALDPRFKTLPTLPQDRRHMVYASLVGLASSDANKIQPTVTVKQEPGIPAATHVQPQPGTSAVVEAITPLLLTLPAVSLQTEGNGGSPPPKKKAAMEDIFGDIYVTKVEPATEVSIGVRAQQEVTKYTDHSQTPGIPLTEDPLLWWKSHQHEFPLLACVARRVLCVPGTSVPSERVFSTAGDVISAQRANLSPENADMLIFPKHNMRVWTLNSWFSKHNGGYNLFERWNSIDSDSICKMIHLDIWRLWCQKKVSRARISNYIPQSAVQCSYISMSRIPASGTKVIVWSWFYASMHSIKTMKRSLVYGFIFTQYCNG